MRVGASLTLRGLFASERGFRIAHRRLGRVEGCPVWDVGRRVDPKRTVPVRRMRLGGGPIVLLLLNCPVDPLSIARALCF